MPDKSLLTNIHHDQPGRIRICPNPECEGDVPMGRAWQYCPLCGSKLEVYTPPPVDDSVA